MDDKSMAGNERVIAALKSIGKSRNAEDFPVLEWYFENFGWRPRLKKHTFEVNFVNTEKSFLSNGCEEVFRSETMNEKLEIEQAVLYISPAKGYLVSLVSNTEDLEGFSESVRKLILNDNPDTKKKPSVLVAMAEIYCPPKDSALYSKEVEELLQNALLDHYMPPNEITPAINMICQEDGDLYMRNFFFQKEYPLLLPDLHYGKGFLAFHDSIISRFRKESKGLFLFHGSPGTGKTYYIRSLIKGLVEMGKFVIYLPPDMVNQIVSPEMMTFLTNTIMDKSDEGKSCVILLEDAESLLVQRDGSTRSSGISNLLNITDGLLNDMLSVQVIATFNTHLEDIDKALLRPERLIARKEFRALPIEDARELVKELDLDIKVSNPMTLAEIYSVKTDNEILVHDYEPEKRKIGFGL